MKRLAIFFALLVTTGCNESPTGEQVPPGLLDLKEHVSSCWADTEFTYPERSEHCVLAAEGLFETYRDDCAQSTSDECMNWKLVHTDLALGYQNAVTQSLVERGLSPEIERHIRKFGHLLYRQDNLMRSLFQQCLADEASELEAKGLIRVSRIMVHPLRSEQRCFRKDYPEFRTKKASVS